MSRASYKRAQAERQERADAMDAWNRAARAGDDRRKAIAEGRYPSRAEQEEANELARTGGRP